MSTIPTIAADNPDLPRLFVSATFTAAPVEESLRFWTDRLSLPHEVAFTSYQQLLQALIDPASDFARNTHGANVALFRLEDLASDGSPETLAAHADEVAGALAEAARRFQVPLIACVCPPSSQFLKSGENRRIAASVFTSIENNLRGRNNLYLLSASAIVSRYRIGEVEDVVAERAAHIPYSVEFFTGLGTEIIRTVHAIERKPLKVVAFDCDNTLWTGVCGEDGPQAVQIDEGRRALQDFLLRQKRAGVLLAIASKNNEADVLETFNDHPEMVLGWSDITARRINWESKSKGLLELAAELNLGLDSFAFLDDDARECGEVRQELPEIATLQVPHATSGIARFLDHAWIFDHVRPATEEDMARPQMYSEAIERSRFEKQAKDLQEFLAGLRLDIDFAPVTPETLPRAAQLMQRTNQMNSTLLRFTEAELKSVLDSGEREAFTATVSDRFGSYGLVGLVLFRESGDGLVVENFLLSCRALGRGVEHKMLAHVGQIALQRGKEMVRIHLKEGPRNQPAIAFLQSVTESDFVTASGGARLAAAARLRDLDVADAIDVKAVPVQRDGRGAGGSKGQPRIDFEAVASLDTAWKIVGAIQERRREQSKTDREAGARPENALQESLATIWRQLLGLETVGIDEDFFDLGGHSLLAVQLLSRIHRDLGIELPDSVIYGDRLRIDNLARAIELQELGVADQGAYDAALAEIESLSDEEVAALLAEDDPEPTA
jgi:HAD-superfamily phosphatase, subfamily IIIC/FkbH-like domain